MNEAITDPPPVKVWGDEVPEGIRRSRAAIRRDLPELLAKRRNRGKWVCYHGDVRVGIGHFFFLISEVNRLNILDGEYFIACIQPGAGSEVEEEIDSGSGGY